MMNKKYFTISFLFMIIGFQNTLIAGNFITEEPVTTDYEHIEYNPSVALIKTKQWSELFSPQIEINVGLLDDFQGHIIFPMLLYSPQKVKKAYGVGDVELGTMYRFIHETDMMPAVAFYPKVTIPTGHADLGLGWGAATESPALWIEKNWSSWKLSGGGGYTFIQAPQTTNYGFGGLLLQQQIMESLSLGGELYAQGTINKVIRSTLIFTFGGSYNFTKNFSFPFSVGKSLAGQNALMAYIGLDWVWGPSS